MYEGPTDERTVFLGDKNVENLKAWMGRHRGHRAFFLIERSPLWPARGAGAARERKSLKIVDESNMKFGLAAIAALTREFPGFSGRRRLSARRFFRR